MPPTKRLRTTPPETKNETSSSTNSEKVENIPEQPPSSSPTTPPPDSHITPSLSLTYWSNTTADNNGMLGGYPSVSTTDIAGSRAFISKVRRLHPSPSVPAPPTRLPLVADCGAGIGRITTNYLSTIAEHIHIIEPIEKFTDQLQIEHKGLFEGDKPVISSIVNVGLESWTPNPTARYALIWNQWCLGHLPDGVLVSYLRRLKSALLEGGFVIVKENLSTEPFGTDIYDEVDSSVTRSDGKFRDLFREAGLKIVRTELQKGMEKLGLYPVRMYALQPAD